MSDEDIKARMKGIAPPIPHEIMVSIRALKLFINTNKTILPETLKDIEDGLEIAFIGATRWKIENSLGIVHIPDPVPDEKP